VTASHVPDIAALRLLVAIGRTGSIGAAARAAGVSQQAASERLRGIEAQTGLTLVQRGARGSELTPSGVVVTEWASRLIELTDEIEAAIVGLRGERSRDVTVWASMTIADSLVPRWLVQLHRQQARAGGPPTSVSLTAANSQQVEDAVRNGSARLGFVEGGDPPRHLRSAVVAHDELVLVAEPDDPVVAEGPLSAADVAATPLTGREAGSGTREVIERALLARGVPATGPVVELTTTTAVREAVLAGGSPAFLSSRFVARDVESGNLVVVPTDLDLRRDFRAVWVGSATPPAGPVRDLVAIAQRTR
jgi:molybdate transport repressor ModE-like protein